MPPLEAAAKFGVAPEKALSWIREYRQAIGEKTQKEGQRKNGEFRGFSSSPNGAKDVLYAAMLLAKEARGIPRDTALTSGAILALDTLASLLPIIEEAWGEMEVIEASE